MKKLNITLSISLITLLFFQSEARVWRLNNQTGVDADVNGTLQNAVDSASSGDTIYVEPSPFDYGNATITKKVIIIGPGYWLSENDSTQNVKDSASVGELIFNSGSQGSIITGLYFHRGHTTTTLIKIFTDSITIMRCYLSLVQPHGATGNTIYIDGNRNGIIIKQNWIIRGAINSTVKAIYINGDPRNLVIKNNLIWCYVMDNNLSIYAIYATTSSSTSNFLVLNNVLCGDIQAYNSLHINNILADGSFNNGSSGICANNLCNGTQYPSSNNNQRNITMSNVFVDYDIAYYYAYYFPYIDNGYLLATNSLAKNAGLNGGDCGIFSDDYGGVPYVLSGIPNIPTIFGVNFNSTVISTNSLQVNIKAKSNK